MKFKNPSQRKAVMTKLKRPNMMVTQRGERIRTGSKVVFDWRYTEKGAKTQKVGTVDDPDISDPKGYRGMWSDGKRWATPIKYIVKRVKY